MVAVAWLLGCACSGGGNGSNRSNIAAVAVESIIAAIEHNACDYENTVVYIVSAEAHRSSS